MNRLVLLLAALNSVYIVPATGKAQDNEKPKSDVPASISAEAQTFLLNRPAISEVIPTTLEQWQSEREKREVLGKKLYEACPKKYAGKATILTFRNADGHSVHVHKMSPQTLKAKNKALIHIHGGGFCFMSPESTCFVCAPLADATGLCVYCVDYRLAPEHPFPAGLDDCVTAYRGIVKEVCPDNLGIFGESAGGSLSLTMLLKARDEGLPMPAALACISPATDLTVSGDSFRTLDGLDPVLTRAKARAFRAAYAGNANLRQPLLSPLFAKYSRSFPPTIIQTGTRDLLLSDCVQLHEKMKAAGVNVELSVREGMWHGYHVLPNSEFPEAKAGFAELAEFFCRELRLRSN